VKTGAGFCLLNKTSLSLIWRSLAKETELECELECECECECECEWRTKERNEDLGLSDLTSSVMYVSALDCGVYTVNIPSSHGSSMEQIPILK
jgi:hypothetical protein